MTDIIDLTDYAKWNPETESWDVVGLNITRDQYTDKEGKMKKVMQMNGERFSFKFQGRLIQKPDKFIPPGKTREQIMADPKARFSCFVAVEYWKDTKKYEADPSMTAAAHAVARYINDEFVRLHPEFPSSQLNLPFNTKGDGVTISMKKSDSMKVMRIIGYRVVSDKETGKPLYERAVIDHSDFETLDKDDCCTWAADTSSQTTNTVTDDKTGEVTMSTQYAPYCSNVIRERRKPAQTVKTAGNRELEDASTAAEAEAADGTTSTFVALDDEGNVVGDDPTTGTAVKEEVVGSSFAEPTEVVSADTEESKTADGPAAPKTAPVMPFDPTILDDEPEDGATKRPRAAEAETEGETEPSGAPRTRRRTMA